MSNIYDVFVIGAGVAGMTASEAAASKGLKVAIAEETMFGGLVLNINHLMPAPEGAPPSGADLSADLMMRTTDLGVEMIMEPVRTLRPAAGGVIEVVTDNATYAARNVIIASGARLRKLGIPKEAEFRHRGVSTCADCDGPIFRGKPVMVVGGGDSAAQEALVLAEFTPTVHLVHRGTSLSARPEFVEAVEASPAISVYYGTVVEGLEGNGVLSAARLRNVANGELSTVPCDGFFAMVGLEPNAGFVPDSIQLNGGWISIDDRMETSFKNIYAIGAVRAGYGGELTHAIEDANRVIAAIEERLAVA